MRSFKPSRSAFRSPFAARAAAAALGFLLAAGGVFAKGAAQTPEAGNPAAAGAAAAPRGIAVFVPGVVAGSPVYEMLVAGVEKAVGETAGAARPVALKIVEGGFNQADWETKLTGLAASGEWDLIVSSNPAMPSLAASVAAKFPKQRFLLLDGYLAGNPAIYTLRYNQREEGYLAGYLAGLATVGGLPGANAEKKIGLVAGQEYPAMNDVILPAFLEGARAVDPAVSVDFRVVGNWYDAAKGNELAAAMLRSGVDVLLPIAGGANQGVLQAAKEKGAYVVWFDVSGYGIEPGTVIGSALLRQDEAAYRSVKRFLAGALAFGEAETVGVRDGFVDFDQADPLYQKYVPAAVRAKMASLVDRLRSGALALPADGGQ
jgi:simple sugar transport system substrate-binding protein